MEKNGQLKQEGVIRENLLWFTNSARWCNQTSVISNMINIYELYSIKNMRETACPPRMHFQCFVVVFFIFMKYNLDWQLHLQKQ